MTTQQNQDALDLEQYNSFIDSLQLLDVSVVSANLRSRTSFADPATTEVQYGFEPQSFRAYEEEPGVFAVFTQAKVAFLEEARKESEEENATQSRSESEPRVLGQVEVSHAIHYSSDIPVDEEIFQAFADGNVQFQVWPFVREFVHSALMRFGWHGFILPTLVGRSSRATEGNDTPSEENQTDS